MPSIIPTAEPFFFPGNRNRVGCLLVHGFTGTPKEMRGMGLWLNHRGHSCLGPRLPGHATAPQDMMRSRWRDWLLEIEDGHHLLKETCTGVCLVGLSMGGALSLLAATQLQVVAVAAISTPYAMPTRLPGWFLKVLSLVVQQRRKSVEAPGASWFDKQAFADHISYPMNPVRSAAELEFLLDALRPALGRVRVPVLLIHSSDDTYVPARNMQLLYDRLTAAPSREQLLVSGSGHVIPRDAAREATFDAVERFLSRLEHS